MADPHLKSILERKALEIEGLMDDYRRILEGAQKDLVHLRGALSVLDRDKSYRMASPQVSLVGVFKRGEVFAIINTALGENPEGLDTGQLAELCLRTKRLDADDKLLRRGMMQMITQMMYVRRSSGQVLSATKRGLTCVWSLPSR